MAEAAHITVGKLGEAVAAKYLKNNGFTVIDTNFEHPWGELDVVASLDTCVHFIEVKTVSHDTKTDLQQSHRSGSWRPEEQVHQDKIAKLRRIIETWCLEQNYQGDIQLDAIAVRMVVDSKYATVEYFPNIDVGRTIS